MPKTLPRLPAFTDYDQALTRRDALAADLRQAHLDLSDLPTKRLAAEKADEDRSAAAILAGKPAPKDRPATAKYQQEAEALKHHASALQSALDQQEALVVQMLQDRREEAVQAATAEAEAAADRYRSALALLEAARQDFHAAKRAQTWVESEQHRVYRVTGAPLLNIPGATTANGEPLPLEPVLAVLRDEIEGIRTRPTTAVFSPGADQRDTATRKRVKVTVPNPLGGPNESHTLFVDPEDVMDVQEAQRQRDQATLARDRAENEAAFRAAQEQGLVSRDDDPLADLRGTA